MTIIIGSQSDVPAPGDPIVSPWHQDTSKKLVHTFADSTARNAWSTRPEGAMAYTRNDNRLWVWDAAAWLEVAKMADVTPKADTSAVNAADALRVLKAGDTMTGNLSVGNPAVQGVLAQTAGQMTVRHDAVSAGGNPNMALDRTGTAAVQAGEPFIRFLRGSSTIGRIEIASASTVAYVTTSDETLKLRTGTVDDAAAQAQTLGHAVYRGTWLADEGAGEEWLFLDAAAVAPVAAYAVSADGDGLALGHLVPLLFAALADALDRLDALETTVT